MTIDALAAGRPEAGRHFAVARAIRLALGACGGSDKFRAAAATTGLAVAGSVAARCAEEFVGVPCGCLGRLPRPARRPWERANSRPTPPSSGRGWAPRASSPGTRRARPRAERWTEAAAVAGAGSKDAAVFAKLKRDAENAAAAAPAAVAPAAAAPRDAAALSTAPLRPCCPVSERGLRALAAAAGALRPVSDRGRRALRCRAMLRYSVGVHRDGAYLSVAVAARATCNRATRRRSRRRWPRPWTPRATARPTRRSCLRRAPATRAAPSRTRTRRAEANRGGGAVAASFAAAPVNASGAALTQRNALYLGALLRCDAVPRFDGAARLEQLLEVPLQEASKRSWLPGETERLVRADAVAGLLAVAAEQPHGDAREVSLRLLRNLTAAWASAFAEDRARTYDFLESQGLAVTDLKEAPTVMAAHGPLVDLYNEHLARLPHDPRPKTLAKWRWGLARVVVRGGLRDTKPKALAKLAAFGFAAAATLVEGPEAGDAGLLALFADLGVLLEHVARYRPRGFLANLRDNDECIADFLDDCKRRRALLLAALTALAAWGRDRGLSRDD
ncbi:hypothetical protein JL721_4985 [Aureococcus anophagefferens]|nr:hypothetical protein JL721_4985 [Aureococcus anophagefferens]